MKQAIHPECRSGEPCPACKPLLEAAQELVAIYEASKDQHFAQPSYPDGVKGARCDTVCRVCGEPMHPTNATKTAFAHDNKGTN